MIGFDGSRSFCCDATLVNTNYLIKCSDTELEDHVPSPRLLSMSEDESADTAQLILSLCMS